MSTTFLVGLARGLRMSSSPPRTAANPSVASNARCLSSTRDRSPAGADSGCVRRLALRKERSPLGVHAVDGHAIEDAQGAVPAISEVVAWFAAARSVRFPETTI